MEPSPLCDILDAVLCLTARDHALNSETRFLPFCSGHACNKGPAGRLCGFGARAHLMRGKVSGTSSFPLGVVYTEENLPCNFTNCLGMRMI